MSIKKSAIVLELEKKMTQGKGSWLSTTSVKGTKTFYFNRHSHVFHEV